VEPLNEKKVLGGHSNTTNEDLTKGRMGLRNKDSLGSNTENQTDEPLRKKFSRQPHSQPDGKFKRGSKNAENAAKKLEVPSMGALGNKKTERREKHF